MVVTDPSPDDQPGNAGVGGAGPGGAGPGGAGDGWGRDWRPSVGWGQAPGTAGTDPEQAAAEPTTGSAGASAQAGAGIRLTELLDSGVQVLARRLVPLVVVTAPLALALAVAELAWWWLWVGALDRNSAAVAAMLRGSVGSADIRALQVAAMGMALAGLVLVVVVGAVRALVDGWVAAIVRGAPDVRSAVGVVRPVGGRIVVCGVALTGVLAASALPAALLLGWRPGTAVLVALVVAPFQVVLLAVVLVRSALMPVALLRNPGGRVLPWGPPSGVPFWAALGVLVLAAALATALGAAASVPVQWLTAILAPPVDDPSVVLDPGWWSGPHLPLAVLTQLVATWVGYPAFSVISALLGRGADEPPTP